MIIEIFSEKNSPLNEKTKNFKEVFYMNLINRIISMFHVSDIKLKKKEKKPSVVKDVVKDPDSFKLEMYVENGEIVVKIRKKTEEVGS